MRRGFLFVLMLVLVVLFSAGCGQKKAEKFGVAAGSTLIADIVQAIGVQSFWCG